MTLDALERALSLSFSVKALPDRAIFNHGITLDGEGVAIIAERMDADTARLTLSANVREFLANSTDGYRRYHTWFQALQKRFGVIFDEDTGELSLTFRGEDMTTAAACYKLLQAMWVMASFHWRLTLDDAEN